MKRIEVAIFCVIIIIMLTITLNRMDGIEDLIESGKHLKNAKVMMSLSADCPWEKLPPFIRDDMAKGWSGNQLSKKDCVEIKNYYERKIATMKDDIISIADDFKAGKLKEEAK